MMFFSKKENALVAVATGRSVPLSEVPDEAFASGILGVGFAVSPTDGTIHSPVSGRIESIADSLHAYTLLSDDGLDVLVHIGIDTVELKGEGFTPHTKEGAAIRAGDPLADADLKLISDRGFSTVTAVLITNHEKIEITEQRYGEVTGGRDAILTYRIVEKG